MNTHERTHRLAVDRAWLPGPVRRARWTTSASIWGGAGLAIVGAIAAAPALLVAWELLVLGGIGAAVVGERAGAVAFRRGLERMTRGEVALADLGHRGEGELVCVRGRVEATETITGALHDSLGVYRRLHVAAGGDWVNEAIADFALVDAAGHRVLVEGAGARWLVEPREAMPYPVARFEREAVPANIRLQVRGTGAATVLASERMLEVGEEVQVVGYKTMTAVADGVAADYRSPPQRATLRSGADLPLVITRVADLTG
ncbi:MAG: hypothetical protein R2939_15850 [Kofleriaceae bacterium]